MKTLSFDRRCYRLDGKPAYLYSGEFHYFRVPRRDWRKRMRLFKAAGGNCLATYCPWLLHEPEEGRFVLGLRWDHAMREHERMLVALLKRLGLRQQIDCSNPNVWCTYRRSAAGSAVFLMNLLSAAMEADVAIRMGGKRLSLGHHRLGPMSVRVVAVTAGRDRKHGGTNEPGKARHKRRRR